MQPTTKMKAKTQVEDGEKNVVMTVYYQLLNSFPARRILVVGDLMLDEYVWGHVWRISPEAPVPVLNVLRRELTPGGAGNVVKNLRAFGTNVRVVGAIGEDDTGQRLAELLQVFGADTSGIVHDPHRLSTLKIRLLSVENSQQLFRLDEESAQSVYGAVEEQIVNLVHQNVVGVQAVVCSDYQKGVLTDRVLKATFAAARECGVPTIVAPKDKTPEKYAGASILMPNLKELGQLVGTQPGGSDWLMDSARHLTEMLGLRALVVTRGCDGMSLFEPARGVLRRVDIPTVARNVFDVTGAGDTALAAFSAAVASGGDFEVAARVANAAAGIVVGKRGTSTATREEIQYSLRYCDSRTHDDKRTTIPPVGTQNREMRLRPVEGRNPPKRGNEFASRYDRP